MDRRIAFSSFAIFVSVAIFSLSAGAQAPYRDPQGRFTVRVPAGWAPAPVGDAVQIRRGNSSALISQVNGAGDSAGILSFLARQFSSQYKNFSELKRGKSTLSGRSAEFAFYSGINPRGVQAFLRIVALDTGQQGYAIIVTAPQAEYASVSSDLDQIERSFALEGSTSAAGQSSSGGTVTSAYEQRQSALANTSSALSNALNPSAPQGTAASASARSITLQPYSVMDKVIGGEAYRLLIPVGWKVDGGLVWRQSPSAPATLSIRIYNPNGFEEIGSLPDIPCTYSQIIARYFPEGSLYLGAEVRRPIEDPFQCLRMMIVPRYQANLKTAAVVSQQELPEVAAAVLEKYPELRGMASARAARMRLEFQQSGKTLQEDLYCVVGVARITSGTLWGPDEIHYSRTEKGKLEEQYRLFQTIIYSLKPQLQWYNKYQQLVQMLVQSKINASNQALELSRYIARTSNAISASMREGFQKRQETMDHVNANWDQYIRGVETYQGPFDKAPVELPSGYNEAWANANGEYIVSNDANFNPNKGSNVNWQRMNKNK